MNLCWHEWENMVSACWLMQIQQKSNRFKVLYVMHEKCRNCIRQLKLRVFSRKIWMESSFDNFQHISLEWFLNTIQFEWIGEKNLWKEKAVYKIHLCVGKVWILKDFWFREEVKIYLKVMTCHLKKFTFQTLEIFVQWTTYFLPSTPVSIRWNIRLYFFFAMNLIVGTIIRLQPIRDFSFWNRKKFKLTNFPGRRQNEIG